MNIVRFDFQNYNRFSVPDCLTRAREEALGVPIAQIKFWALENANLETAPVVERKEISTTDERFFIANVEIANRIVELSHKLANLRAGIDDCIATLDEDIQLANELEDEGKMDKVHLLDKHICENNCFIEQDLAQLDEKRQALQRRIDALVVEYKRSIIPLKQAPKFEEKVWEDYDGVRWEFYIYPFYPEVLEIL